MITEEFNAWTICLLVGLSKNNQLVKTKNYGVIKQPTVFSVIIFILEGEKRRG